MSRSDPARAASPEEDGDAGPSGLVNSNRTVLGIERLLGLAPAVLLFAMMVLTFANVLMRYLFTAPISGAFELMSYMMGLLVFLSLPLVTARSAHVRISLIDGALGLRVRQVRAVAFNLLMAAMSAGLAWRLWIYAERLMGWGDRTQMYGLSRGGLAGVMAACCAICAVLFVILALRAAINRHFVERIET